MVSMAKRSPPSGVTGQPPSAPAPELPCSTPSRTKMRSSDSSTGDRYSPSFAASDAAVTAMRVGAGGAGSARGSAEHHVGDGAGQPGRVDAVDVAQHRDAEIVLRIAHDVGARAEVASPPWAIVRRSPGRSIHSPSA